MNPISRIISLSGTFIVLGVLCAGAANAQSAAVNPMINDKWAFWMGGFFPQISSDIRLDTELGSPGGGVDLEDTLGLEDSKSVLWGGLRWRISRRNQLEMEFVNLNRDGFRAGITEPIQIDDALVQGVAAIASTFDIALARLTYGFSVIRDDRQDLALKAGVHLTNLKVAFQLAGDLIDVDTGQPFCSPSPCVSDVFKSDELTLPLPHLGLSYAYAFTPKLGLRTQAIGFYIKINDIEGSLVELDLDLHYQPWDHFGLGAGLRYFDVNVDDEGDAIFRGKLDYRYWGPAVYGLFSF